MCLLEDWLLTIQICLQNSMMKNSRKIVFRVVTNTFFNAFAVALPLVFFLLLIKISLGNSYLKIHDLSILFIADARLKKKSENLVLPLLTLKYGSENRSWVSGLNFF